MIIREIDPATDDLRDHVDVTIAAECFRRPYATPWRFEEIRADALASRPDREVRYLLGDVAGLPVAAAGLRLPLTDNRDQAYLTIAVLPAARRRGHGAALLAHLEQRAVAAGRRMLNAEAPFPLDGSEDGAGWPAVDFLYSNGFRLTLTDTHSLLELPVPGRLLDQIGAEAAAHHTDYRIETFVGPVPEPWLAGYAALDSRLEIEAPTGTAEKEAKSADLQRYLDLDATCAAQGRVPLRTLALCGEEVVGYTDILVARHDPGRAYQWGTLVAAEHRGHRLGAAIKTANLRLLQREHPEVRQVFTCNAEQNAQMLAINHRLGFRQVERLGEFQKRLDFNQSTG